VGHPQPGFCTMPSTCRTRDVTIEGLHFYGAPWTAGTWPPGRFIISPPDMMRAKWDLIPERTDILITHTPPLDVLDRNRHGRACGCPDPGFGD